MKSWKEDLLGVCISLIANPSQNVHISLPYALYTKKVLDKSFFCMLELSIRSHQTSLQMYLVSFVVIHASIR